MNNGIKKLILHYKNNVNQDSVKVWKGLIAKVIGRLTWIIIGKIIDLWF